MGGLSLKQWLVVLARLPVLIPLITAALPTLLPLIRELVSLVQALGLDAYEPDMTVTHAPVPLEVVAHKVVTGGLTEEQERWFAQAKGNIG